ncbi:MAG: NUDIX domain-containing protein [Oligoflexales bacterium]|nr:NUDIX domain-containing protein [Oligoflexales bacterium]
MNSGKGELGYRPGVVAVFINDEGKLLVGRRSGMDAWQFPQGGVDLGESFEEALFREALEEIGSKEFKIIRKSGSLISYDFPEGMAGKMAESYCGQKQAWYLCKFEQGQGPDLDNAVDEEFDAVAWVDPAEALAGIIDWKKSAYVAGLRQLGLTEKD